MDTGKLMGLMPKLMAALSSGNFKAIVPDLLTMLDDKQLDGIRGALVEFAQKKCAEGITFSVVFEPNESLSDIHMRIWKFEKGKDAQCVIDIPFCEVRAEDLKALITPLLQQA